MGKRIHAVYHSGRQPVEETVSRCAGGVFDERFTSVIAHRGMIDSGMRKMQRRDKALVDEMAATIILNDYLQSKQYNDNPI